jgi:hypothetical protein
MTTKNIKTSRLTEALLETAKDMNNVGMLGEAAYEKITMRHLPNLPIPTPTLPLGPRGSLKGRENLEVSF